MIPRGRKRPRSLEHTRPSCIGAGLLVVYVIVPADILAGHPGQPGILCDFLNGAEGCGDRALVSALVCIVILAPLCSLKRVGLGLG